MPLVSKDTASETVPTRSPHVITCLALGLTPTCVLARTDESEIHITDCAAVPPDLALPLKSLDPRPDPLTSNSIVPYAPALKPEKSDKDTASKDTAPLLVPRLTPTLTAKTVVSDAPLDARHHTAESDTHAVDEAPVLPNRALVLYSMIPKSAPLSSPLTPLCDPPFAAHAADRKAASTDPPSVRDPAVDPTVMATLRLAVTPPGLLSAKEVSDTHSVASADD